MLAQLTIAYASGKTFKRTDDLGSLRTIAAEAIAHNRTLASLFVIVGDNVHAYDLTTRTWSVSSLEASRLEAMQAAYELAQADEDAMAEAFAEYETAAYEAAKDEAATDLAVQDSFHRTLDDALARAL